MSSSTLNVKIKVSEDIGEVSGIFLKPENAVALYVFAHGAGAGMYHSFMERVAHELRDNNIASLRYQFPYMENGKKRPDSPGIAIQTVVAAFAKAKELAKDLPLLAGGKSFGGRMTSQAASKNDLDVRALVFLGFPLHAPGRNTSERADHLKNVDLPMLFLQGSRDSLAKLELLEPVVKELDGKAVLKILEGGDHSFKTRKKDGISEDEIFDWIGKEIKQFIKSLDN